MNQSTLLQKVLSRLNRGDAPDSRWPDAKGEYWALCPFHPDTHATNFSVSERGYKCFACGASGALRHLAQVLQCCIDSGGDITPSPLREHRKGAGGLTLEEYAQAKALPLEFLKALGLETIYLNGTPAVRIPYVDQDASEVGGRLRLAMTGDQRFRWRKGTKVSLYGLQRLGEARKAGYVILVEGESDAQTLWFHGIPALGVPGASTWRKEWAEYLEGLTVFLWREPDEGGAQLVARVGETLPKVRILEPPEGRKDISECHILGDDVAALVQRLMAEAKTHAEIQAETANAQALEAEREARALLDAPDILALLEGTLRELGLVGEAANAKLLYLALTSRLLEKPVSVVVKGPSSAGKSYLVETVLKTMPEEAYLDFTSMSERALIYDERPLQRRFIVLFEATGLGRDQQDEPSQMAYYIRSLLSEGRVKYTTTEKTAEGLRPRYIEREGPTGLITTTTWASLHHENETRMLSITVKDDPGQTMAIMAALADRYSRNSRGEVSLAPWHALQRWLTLAGQRDVVIPYAPEIARRCNPRAVRMRRDFGKVLTLIQAHAMLHQRRRPRDEHGHIVATLEDYAAVYELIHDIMDEGIEATVSPTIRETVQAVRELLEEHEEGVTISGLAAYLGLDKSATSRRVRVAMEHGYLVNLEERRGRPARLALGDPLPADEPAMPSPEDLETFLCPHGGGGGMIYPSETLQHCNTATLNTTPDGGPIDDEEAIAYYMAQGLTRAEALWALEAERLTSDVGEMGPL